MGGKGGGGGKKGGGAPYYVEYRMTMHYGIAHGPIDALLGIYVKERDAWPGVTVYSEEEEDKQQTIPNVESFADLIKRLSNNQIQPSATTSVVTGPAAIPINRPDLFGGNEKEGGVKGEAYWLPGRDDQIIPEHIAARYGLTSATMVGYRGLASIYFSGGGPKGGFVWGANNPYLNAMWATVFRSSGGLDQTKQTIQIGDYPPDTNAANIIFESLTNDDWGMGASETLLDMESFVYAQKTFFDERFGLSLAWVNQTTIEAFVTEILDHVQATLFVNPMTGLLTIKPIRGDYVVEDLPRFGPHNCDLSNRKRKLWGETINEINIGFTNPKNEETETVTFQDLANIAMQGGEIVSETRDYYGIRNKELASMVGARDMRTACQPLFSTDMETDRSGWKLTPGSCLVLDWPEDGLSGMVMRVMNVDYGRPGSLSVKVTLLEDIFSLTTATWDSPPVTEWTEPTSEPSPADYVEIVTAPWAILARAGLPPNDDLYPRVVPAILAASDDLDTNGFFVTGSRVLPNGATEQAQVASFAPSSRGELAVAFTQRSTSTVTRDQLGFIVGPGGPEVAGFAMLGTGADAGMELIMFDSYNANTGVWTIARGILDTVPRAWPVGTPIWYLEDFGVDTNERLAGTTVQYRIQSRTSGGILPLALSPVYSKALVPRPYLPSRPANVRVNNVAIDGNRRVYTGAGALTVTWSHRNRLMEDTVIRRWDEGNVAPEEGQTTRIDLLNDNGGLIKSYTGLTGTSFSIPYTDWQGGWRFPFIRVLSERDGFVSLQGVDIGIEWRLHGYGNSYGNDYGQNDG